MKKVLLGVVLSLSVFLAACGETEEDIEWRRITFQSDVVEEDELIAEPDTRVEKGTEVTIEAPDVDGYEFSHWFNRGEFEEFTDEQVYTFEIEFNKILEAVYEEE